MRMTTKNLSQERPSVRWCRHVLPLLLVAPRPCSAGEAPSTARAQRLLPPLRRGKPARVVAFDDSLTAGHSWTPTTYAIGSDPRCDEWLDNSSCGGGLHVCPTAWQALDHYNEATRYLEITAPLDSLRPIDATKCKAPTVHVLREVDLNMRPVKEARP